MQTLDLDVTTIAHEHCVCGEGPIWHDTERKLYWQDIPTGRLFRYDPQKDTHELVYRGRFIGATTIQADDSLLLLGEDCEVLILRDGQATPVLEGIEGETRFNDAIADPRGRVFSGSMPKDAPDGNGKYHGGKFTQLGKLYRIDPDGSYRVVDEGFGCANGFGFTPDGKGLYFTDSNPGVIYRYDYDADTGQIGNRRVFWEDHGQTPDGMSMDSEGNLWSARWGGSCVVRHDGRTGEETAKFMLSTPNITSIFFGGEARDTGYITSASGDPENPKQGDTAGATFAVSIPGVRGVPEHRSRVGLS
ncbi:MAG: SMP-30/gluconolactonase/LRE family protein [Planctomycetota bacterium]